MTSNECRYGKSVVQIRELPNTEGYFDDLGSST